MLSANRKKFKFRVIDGIVMQPNWTETFKALEPGQSQTFQRKDITTFQARVLASKLNNSTEMQFTVSAGEMEEYCTVKRVK